MKKFIPILTMALLILLSSCTKEEEDKKQDFPSSENSITSFSILDIKGSISNISNTVIVNLPFGTDLSSLTPDIEISADASINPMTGVAQDFNNSVKYIVTSKDGSITEYLVTVFNTCTRDNSIHSFTFNNKKYELVTSKKSWIDAAACAVERGGYLAEINSVNENSFLFNTIINNDSITLDKSAAADGGEANYIWLGANDIKSEGVWIWDGDNDENSVQFWEGGVDGKPIGGLYSNWGTEPDNFSGGQDCLGLAFTQWPLATGTLGSPRQWNDVRCTNKLYYIIEYD